MRGNGLGSQQWVPVSKPRVTRTCALSMIDEDCTMEGKSIMGDAAGTNVERTAGSVTPTTEPSELPVSATGGVEGNRVATLPKSLGVRYFQPGRCQP